MAAASPLPISVTEYLHMSCRPDCDYVDSATWTETRSFADPNTGIRLDLDSLFASIDDALGDSSRA
jgi:hypothetical protein